jgi:hypothetical protein
LSDKYNIIKRRDPMRPLFTSLCKIILALNLLPVLVLPGPAYGASITSGIPGAPGVTTNTLMTIYLDTPVAMVGTQPDMTYCVKKLDINVATQGFDYSFTDVACDAAAADDRLSVSLYPQDLLDSTSQYAYKIVSLTFQAGGSAQNFSQCYITGSNPVIPPVYAVNEADQCTDYNYIYNSLSGGGYCFKCHVGGSTRVGPWDFATYPVPECAP